MPDRRPHRSRSQRREYVVPRAVGRTTLLSSLAEGVRELSRESAERAIAVGCVFVDGKRVTEPTFEVRPGQRVAAHLGRPFEQAVLERELRRPPLPAFRVLYEDEHLLAVFKPSGLLTAPTPEGRGSDLLTLLANDARKPLTVHRLDLETSGVLLFAKGAESNRVLAETFRVHDLTRRYDAFVGPNYPVDAETLSSPIDGRAATSRVRVVARAASFTRLEVTLETGRTHQIRKHLLGRGFPVLADTKYGTRADGDPPRLALHARLLELKHPLSGEPLRFEVELPEELAHWAQRAEGLPSAPPV